MEKQQPVAPDRSAVRVALWRALHLQVDAPPHVFEDAIGLRLADPQEGWRRRPDMHQHATRRNRASIVARARFIEDLVLEQAAKGVGQYVILGAGLDTFVQRRPESVAHLHVFEIDQPGPQAWKRQRLMEAGFGIPEALHLVPVDFEAGESWREALAGAGFDASRPAVVASAGVSLYLTKEANSATLRQVAGLAPGSTLVLSFMLPLALTESEEHPALKGAARGAQASGTPFVSFFAPAEIVALAREAGFNDVRHVSAGDLTRLYFADRSDGLRPSSSEELIVATV